MSSLIASSIGCLVIGFFAVKISNALRNYNLAKTSGFSTFYSPVHFTEVWWVVFSKSLAPFLRKILPTRWQEPWISLSEVLRLWRHGHTPFKNAGSDTVMLAAPGGNVLWTCDPAVVEQIYTQPDKFHIATDVVRVFEILGSNVGTTNGPEWKRHRAVISAGFNPSTNAIVWQETLKQTSMLIDCLESQGGVLQIAKEWTSRLALHVISGVFFQKPLSWQDEATSSNEAKDGHKMSFAAAMPTLLSRLGYIIAVPRLILRSLPVPAFQEANTAFEEWAAYIKEIRDVAVGQLETIKTKVRKTFLESIVLAGSPEGDEAEKSPLTDSDVLGNIFFLILAGHETTGITLSFIMMLLAAYPEYQRKVQAEVDALFAGRPQSEWSVEKDFPALQSGLIGAVQKEVLRLYHAFQFTPRVTASAATVVDSKGVKHTIPANTHVCPNYPASFRNQDVWKERHVPKERLQELHHSPALFFDPERWLREDAVKTQEVVPASYFPFGRGPRRCPGSVFTQTEMTAAMASIFSSHSLELVVSEEMLAKCGGDASIAWNRTRDDAFRTMVDDVEFVVGVTLLTPLPLRLVPREKA